MEAFRDHHPSAARLELLYNWADDRPGKRKESGIRKFLGLDDKVIFLYGGAITKQQDIPNLLRLAKFMQTEPEAHFLIVGEGYDLPNVEKIVKQQKLQNVTICPPVDQNAFRDLLAEVDIGLFSLSRDHSTHNFPGKILGYLVQGLPIIGSVNPGNDLEMVISSAGAGLVAINGEDTKLQEAALRLLKNAAARAEAGAAARNLLATKFSVSSAAAIIEQAWMCELECQKCVS